MFTLLSLVCLDAPLVAVSWQWLFARAFHTHVDRPERVALFLSAWFIYLGDRVADSFTITWDSAMSQRQRFCLEHRGVFIVAIVLILVADCACAFLVNSRTLLLGGIVALFIMVYLAVNHLTPSVWRRVPLKEVSVGLLFALGTIIATVQWRIAFVISGAFFALLCILNCLSISVWECRLDQAQQRVSFATVCAPWMRLPELGCWSLAIAALSLLASPSMRAIALCLVSSALLLALLHRATRMTCDDRVALADLILLTPLIVLCSRSV
ncbi:MAG: hypothetical protein ACR2FX_09640 [Chthoniobacterales bacterium]